MNKKKLWLLSLLVGSAFTFTACSSDDDDNGGIVMPEVARMQVTVVFEPEQLGDQGYADRILRGLTQLKQDEETASTNDMDVKYISQEDADKTQSAMQQWTQQRNNPYATKVNYERRLLVLTKATQLAWLNEKDLSDGDEVLLLNADKSVIASSVLASRIHVLNISAATSAEKYFKYIDEEEQMETVPLADDIGLLRVNNQQLYADSIAETFKEHYADRRELQTLYFDEEAGDVTNMTAASYRLADFFADYQTMGFYFSIIDLGNANMGYDYYLFNNEENYGRTLMLDSENNSVLPRFSICRKFDEAIKNWIGRWKVSEVGSLPQEEWHGAWDGYVEDNIDL